MKLGEIIPNINLRLVSFDGTKDFNLHNDFKNNEIISKNIIDWIDKFCEEFCLIGKKLIS